MRKFLTALVAVAAIGVAVVATSSTADARWGGGWGWRGGWAGALDRLLRVLCSAAHWLLVLPHTTMAATAMALTTPMPTGRTDRMVHMAMAVSGCGTAITGSAPVTDEAGGVARARRHPSRKGML
jgi:hypothetical protein